MDYILGIDAGTSSFKGVLYDLFGKPIASASEEYTLLTPAPDQVEFPAEEYYAVLCHVIRRIIGDADIRCGQIRALAIDSQGETIIALDKKGNPLCNAIVWLDNRATAEAGILAQEFPPARIFAVTGQPEVTACWPATKLLWLRRNRRDIFDKADKFLLLEDYLIYRLTGEMAAEKSLLSSTTYLDIHRGCWWEEMLSAIDVTPAQLPQILPSGKTVACVSAQAAGQTGLSRETRVVTGTLDQIAGMIGAGATRQVMETTGSCLAILAPIGHAPKVLPAVPIPCHLHAIEGQYLFNAWTPTAGLVLKWFKDGFYQELPQQARYDMINREAALAPPGCDGVTVLPHYSGAACPEFNPDARGVIYGLTLKATRGHITRAIMECIAYMLRSNLELLRDLQVSIPSIRSLGGGAKSPLWNQIKADVLGCPVETVDVDEAACFGAALLAGVGAGLYGSLEQAGAAVKVTARYEPQANPAYEEGYSRYIRLYESLEPMFHH